VLDPGKGLEHLSAELGIAPNVILDPDLPRGQRPVEGVKPSSCGSYDAGHVLGREEDFPTVVPSETHSLAEVDGVLRPVESQVCQLPLDILVERLNVLDGDGVRRYVEQPLERLVKKDVIHNLFPLVQFMHSLV